MRMRSVRVEGTVVHVWQAGHSNELKDLLEGVLDVLASLIVEVQVQVLQVGC